MHGEPENQFCLTRAALSASKRPETNFLSVQGAKFGFLATVIATTWCWLTVAPQSAFAAAGATMKTAAHTIRKEPRYQSTPKYCLLSLGNRGDVKVWMVEDGRRLFVDKNANGDLTDDGPAIAPSKLRDIGNNRWDFEYVLDAIQPASGPQHTNLVLRRWNYNDPTDQYGLSLTVNGDLPMYAGWFGTFWSTNREQAPVIHFGGPFTPKLLRRKEFTLGETQQRLSLCFLNPGSGPGAESRLSIEALPKLVVPELTIEWPAVDGKAPVRTTHHLTQRCCYWEFYNTEFELPKSIVPGTAKISVELPGKTVLDLTTIEITAPVVSATQEQQSGNQARSAR